jgi:hypothetical protein
MADSSQEEIFGFADEAPKRPEDRPAPPPPRPRRPKKTQPTERSTPGAPLAKSTRTRDIVTVSVLIAIFLTVAIVMAVRQTMQQNEERSALQAAVGEFLFTPQEPGPGVARPKVGKVILVDMDKQVFDDFHMAIHEDLRAHNPAEAVTVAQMRYTRQQVGRFEMGARAIQLSCTMTLADRATKTLIATRSFTWGKPPTSIPRSGNRDDVNGSAPLDEIKAFLTGLR